MGGGGRAAQMSSGSLGTSEKLTVKFKKIEESRQSRMKSYWDITQEIRNKSVFFK